MRRILRTLMIGLTDGLTIAFAIVCGLTVILSSSQTIATACLSLVIAWSITMMIGAYLTGKKEAAEKPLGAAILVGLGYVAGGIIPAVPFAFGATPVAALSVAAGVSVAAMMVAGFVESRVNGANPWAGAARVTITGIIAAGAAYGMGMLFR